MNLKYNLKLLIQKWDENIIKKRDYVQQKDLKNMEFPSSEMMSKIEKRDVRETWNMRVVL